MKNRIQEAFQDFWNSVITSTPDILVGFILFLIFFMVGWLLRSFVRKRLTNKIKDRLLLNFIGRMTILLFSLVGIILFLGQVGLKQAAGGMLAGAGVSALILGFAFKDIGENFIAGFFLALSRPFGIGDIIQVESFTGTVKFLHLRNSHIRTFDGRDIFIPNAMILKNALINYTRDGLLRHDFVVGLDFDEDLVKASKSILNEMAGLPNIVQTEELAPFVIIDKFGVSTVDIRIHFWINTKDFLGSTTVLKSHVMQKIFERLKREGFTMPADIIELKIYQEGRPIPITLSKDNDIIT